MKSITYNDITNDRQKGEELTNYTQNYNTFGQVTSTAVYFYGTDRAEAAAGDALNSQINTFRKTVGVDATIDTTVGMKSITYNDITNDRQKGEELTNYTQNYNTFGQVTSTAVYFYGTDRAEAAAGDALNSQINTFRKTVGVDATIDTTVGMKSITYNDITNDRQKGEELTNYTQNYNTFGQVTSTAVYFYGTDRAEAAAGDA